MGCKLPKIILPKAKFGPNCKIVKLHTIHNTWLIIKLGLRYSCKCILLFRRDFDATFKRQNPEKSEYTVFYGATYCLSVIIRHARVLGPIYPKICLSQKCCLQIERIATCVHRDKNCERPVQVLRLIFLSLMNALPSQFLMQLMTDVTQRVCNNIHEIHKSTNVAINKNQIQYW